jgi:hypothetical protein
MIENEKIIQNGWRDLITASGGRSMQPDKPFIYDVSEYEK